MIRRIARRIAPLFRSSTAFTTTHSPDRSADLFSERSIHPLVNSFPDGSCGVLLAAWLIRYLAHWIAGRITHYFRSAAFPTVCAQFC